MKVFGMSDRGKIRKENQDSFLISEPHGRILAVVCDGMGGAAAGRVASEAATVAFVSRAEADMDSGEMGDLPALVETACAYANADVYSMSRRDLKLQGMGTTLVAALVGESEAVIVNVGDSRAYHVTADSIRCVTRDHSLVQELLDRGDITASEAEVHPNKNIITRALGVESDVEGDVFREALSPGDTLLLVTDGLSNVLAPEELLAACWSHEEPEDICRDLFDKALKTTPRDNITVVAVRV